MKKRLSKLLCIVFFVLLCNTGVYAAEPVGSDNHTDTADYCLRANDVQLGLAELGEYAGDQERYEAILKAADPIVLIRGDGGSSEGWIRLDRTQYVVDYQNIKWHANALGYAVTITAPPVFLEEPSYVTFRVYVVDDLPKPVMATIRFYGSDLPDLQIDITKGNTVRLKDLTVPVKQGGFTFKGWYLDEEFKIPFLILEDEAYSEQFIENDLILYAKWEKTPLPVTPTEPEETPTPMPPTKPEETPTPVPPIKVEETPIPVPPIKAEETPAAAPPTKPEEMPAQVPLTKPKGTPTPVPTATEEIKPSPTQAQQEPTAESEPQPETETIPTPTEEPKEAPKEETKKESKKENKEETTPNHNGGVTLMEIISLLTGSTTVLVLASSIASDLRVLHWYGEKKKARLAH